VKSKRVPENPLDFWENGVVGSVSGFDDLVVGRR
jgi:hypothetical protein